MDDLFIKDFDKLDEENFQEYEMNCLNSESKHFSNDPLLQLLLQISKINARIYNFFQIDFTDI